VERTALCTAAGVPKPPIAPPRIWATGGAAFLVPWYCFSMARRPDRFGFNTTLPATVARAGEVAAEIMGDPDPTDLAFLHSVLAQCGLPYRDQKGARDYIRKNGLATLIVSAGFLMDPVTKKPALQGVPYGAKPRLLMIHLCTEAIRTQSAIIGVGDSMSAFMQDLGFHVTGGKHGTVGRFKEQLNRLAAARMQLTMDYGDKVTTINPAPVISRFDVWYPSDHRQRVMWPSEVHLSNEFFTSLKGHALPLDPRALRGLMHNARALDIYTWLAHRLPRVKGKNGAKVSWMALHMQFGPDVKDQTTFRRQFRKSLLLALSVYPRAKVERIDGGLLLQNSPPPIHRRVYRVGHSRSLS